MHRPPYYTNYSPLRLFVHNVVTSKYFDLAIAAVIGLNVVTMAMEYYKMPDALKYALKIFNYFFTAVFILEAIMKVVALGVRLYMKDKWNQLDVAIVILSVVGIILEELETKIIPINPTIIRVMRVMRIARVLKLLKMAKGIRALLDTVMQALPQVCNNALTIQEDKLATCSRVLYALHGDVTWLDNYNSLYRNIGIVTRSFMFLKLKSSRGSIGCFF